MSTAEAWTVGRLLTWTADYLKKHGSTSPRLDAEVLLAEARGCQRIDLYTAFTEEPSEEVRTSFREMVRRRAEGAPVAYLVGRKEFYSLPFEINPDVLIPRPETEHLVLEAIDRAKLLTGQTPGKETLPTVPPSNSQAADSGAGEGGPRGRAIPSFQGLKICDVGTGSGIIAVTLAKALPGAAITALDSSPAALAVAARNIQQHGVSSHVQLLNSDLLSSVADHTFDLIVSNPPYISDAEYAQLPDSVRLYEPKSALVAGPTGTEIIARLIDQAARQLTPGGWLLIELSPMIADRVASSLSATHWCTPTLVKDLAGLARVLVVQRRGDPSTPNAPSLQQQ